MNIEEIRNKNPRIEPVPAGIKRPLWSVMIPTYNPGKYFIDAVNSVLRQDLGEENMQIEVVDDCSTKVDVKKIVEENWKGRVRYHRLPKNVGHSFNFTECIRRSVGELVHILHDDDMVKEGFYPKFKNKFAEFPEIGAAFCRQEYIDDDGKFMFFSDLELEEPGIIENAVVRLAEKQRIQYCAMVVKRSTYEKVGGYIAKNIGCEDWEMWVRIASQFPVAYQPEALAQYRIHRKSMTLTDMRSGQDMRFLKEAADVFTQYLPEEKRDEVTQIRNKHYSVYSMGNARRMFEEFGDEEGAAAQLSETILLNSETVFENIDLLRKLKLPVRETGVTVVVQCRDKKELTDITLRNIVNQRVPAYIPWEVIFADNTNSESIEDDAEISWKKYRSKIPFCILDLQGKNLYEARKETIDKAKYNFIVFCNPGNLLNINYVEEVSLKMLQNRKAGALGGMTESTSKIKLPDWFASNSEKVYQIGVQFKTQGNISDSKGYLWSAGIALRKESWNSLIKKDYFPVSGNGLKDLSLSGFDRMVCRDLNLNGWQIIYSEDLALKNYLSESELSWKHLRKLYRQSGKDKALLLSAEKNSGYDLRKLLHTTGRKLRKFKQWKLRSFNETLERDPDILKIEYYTGILSSLLGLICKSDYNKRLRILKSLFRKKDHKYYRNFTGLSFFRFPKYKNSKSRHGFSVILNNQNISAALLIKSVQHIFEQDASVDMNFELMIISSSLEPELKNKIKEIRDLSGKKANIIFANGSFERRKQLIEFASDKSKFDNIIFLSENDFIGNDYFRIAFKVLKKFKKAGIIGGRKELTSNVKSPKWINSHKDIYALGTQNEASGDISNSRGFIWNSGMIARKQALKDTLSLEVNRISEIPIDKYFEPAYDLELCADLIRSGWKIYYEQRLKLKHFVTVKEFSWEFLRDKYFYDGISELNNKYLNVIYGNEVLKNKSWTSQALETISEIKKYPLSKVFSYKDEYSFDNEVLEIEKKKGKLKAIFNSRSFYRQLLESQNNDKIKNGSNGSNGSGHLTQNGKARSDKEVPGVSVVICCYNSAKILPLTLKYLFRQSVPENVKWEIIIVDNASTDNTSGTALEVYERSSCLTPMRIVRENTPGLSIARQKGFDTAKYEYIVFCDDDNLLKDDFVRTVYEVMTENDDTAVCGGQGKAEFYNPPSKWFDDWKNSFAVGKQSERSGDITWSRGYVWGASMIVRKKAWKQLLNRGFRSLLTDRKGNALSAGGDTEICYALRNAGWKIRYDSRLKYKHYLPPGRLNWMYLRRMFRGFGQASIGLDHYLRNTPLKFRKENKKLIPRSVRKELHKTLKILRSIRYEKLLTYSRKREGDTDLPMIEYCLGRIEGLLKTRGTYNKGIKLLKRIANKNDYPYLASIFRDYHSRFPEYKRTVKLNGVSVIVCTYNGADRLADTIRHLALQKVDKNLLWEVILVDNASTDNSKEVTINEWKKHNCKANLIIVDQPEPGKQLALEKGYEVAKYEYLVTCDDDNWLEENFVQLTYEIMSKHENIGALGGPNEALCEVKPPEWFKYFQRDYAAGPQLDIHTGKISEGNITYKRGQVWGAGMVVRKKAWDKLIADGFRTSMSCRKGAELSSGGDSEACYALVLAGWDIWYDPRLKLKHCMPAGRLDWNYLVRLFVGFGVATVGLGLYEKAIKLGMTDTKDEELLKQDWKYEFKKTLKDVRKYGIKKILSLRLPQYDNTDILMLEFNISRLKELWKVRKEYDNDFKKLINAPWKKKNSELKDKHRKILETENDFRYGWPWGDEPVKNIPADKTFPKISILTPSFNSESTIEKAILSVLKQGYPNFEHIIYDGGSKDNTLAVLKKYPHLKWVSEPDKGQSDAMNKAFNKSDGEIISYLNADDYYSRGAFFKIAEAFEKNPEAEMVVGNLIFDFEDHTFIRKPEIDYKKIMLPFLYMFPINPVSYFYKREVQKGIGPFPIDNHMTMDYWFLLKAYQDYKLVKIEDYLGTFFMNGYNKTSTADNRKNTHHRVVYHCWHYDKKNLLYYLYNYYRFFYYEEKPYNLKRVSHKLKKQFRRIYSVLTLKKNKYYAHRLYESSRYKYYEKKRIRSLATLMTSFMIYPKGLTHRSKQSQFVYSFLGSKYSEKAKLAYFFFTTPPGLPLGNKLNYYANEFRNNNKTIKGNALLLLTFIVSPKFIFKGKESQRPEVEVTGFRKVLRYLNPFYWLKKPVNFFRYNRYNEISYNLFEKAGYKHYHHKNLQAAYYMILSFLIYPNSLRQRSRLNLFTYSAFGTKLTNSLRFYYHLYKDNPEYTLAHKLNYFGNQLRNTKSSFKGSIIRYISYILSPKYFFNRQKREKVKKSNIVFVTEFMEEKKNYSVNPKVWVKNSADIFRKSGYKAGNAGKKLQHVPGIVAYRFKSVYYYFRYRKFKEQSKNYYAQAIENYKNNKRLGTITALIPSYLLYPVSIFNRNKLSLIKNSILGNNKKNSGSNGKTG